MGGGALPGAACSPSWASAWAADGTPEKPERGWHCTPCILLGQSVHISHSCPQKTLGIATTEAAVLTTLYLEVLLGCGEVLVSGLGD